MTAEADLPYNQVFQDLPEPYIIFDLHGPGYDVFAVSRGYLELASKTAPKSLTAAVRKVLPRTPVSKLKEVIGELNATGLLQELELSHTTEDRSTQQWLLSFSALPDTRQAKLGLLHLAVQPMTSADMKLARQEYALRLMSDSLPVILFTATTAGQINYCNKKWIDYTGIAPTSEDDYGWKKIIHPDDLEEANKEWKYAFEHGRHYEKRFRLRRHDGAYRLHISRAAPIYDEHHNRIVMWFGSCIDIDDLQRASSRQEKLEQVTRALRQQRKELVALNRTKDEFISLASHQLRTPATATKQYISMLLEGYIGELSEEQKAMLQIAYDSNERQLATVNDLLRVAQADAGKIVLQKEPVDFVVMLRQIVDGQRHKFEMKNQTVELRHRGKKVIAFADKARMRMVLENIIDNASKYTPEGKKITIECFTTADIATLRVADQGVGIEGAYIPKLFQKFSRIENPLSTKAGGTGLGLYWAHKIVTLHHGMLQVDSIVNKGTILTVTLPGGRQEKPV